MHVMYDEIGIVYYWEGLFVKKSTVRSNIILFFAKINIVFSKKKAKKNIID